jgi:alpha-tubulin suppressor-like RCC1 family protein
MTSAASLLRAKTPPWVLLAAMILLPRAGFAAAPNITNQPQSTNVLAGSNATFKATASGSPTPGYQWSFNGVNLVNSTHIGGATGTTLTVSNVTATDAGNYRVGVTNSHGGVVSSNATLTVLFPPTVTIQPKGRTVFVGAQLALSAATTGTQPLGYQWHFNGANLNGATNTTLLLANLQTNQSGNYSLQASNFVGVAVSSNAAVIVSTTPDCTAPPSGLVSWWQGEGNAADVTGTNNGALSAAGASYTNGLVGRVFRFDGTNGCVQIPDSPLLKPANVTIEAWVWLDPSLSSGRGGEQIVFKKNTWSAWFEGYSLLKAPVDNGDGTSSDRFQFCVSRSGNQVAINSQTIAQRGVWYHVAATYDGNQSTLYINGVAEASATPGFALDYDTTPVFIGTSGTWPPYLSMFGGIVDEPAIYSRALPANEIAAIYFAGNSGKCVSSYPPVIVTQPQGRMVFPGAQVTLSAAATGAQPISYQWLFNGTNLTDGPHYAGSSTGSVAISSVLPADSGNYYLIVTNSFGSATSAVATLTVLFPPNIVIQPANPAAPIGSNITLTATGTGADPMSYQWSKDGTNLTDGGNISGATTSALALANLQFGDAGTYSVVVTNIYGSVTNSTTLRVTVPAGTWVKWDAGLGGNGHWYKGVVNATGLNWMQADQAAHSDGGYLAVITSAEENNFVFNVVNDPQFFSGSGGNGSGPALGGVRTNFTSPASADWTWETGEPWSYTAWGPGQPDSLSETRLEFWSGIQGSPSPNWNNLTPLDSNLGGYVIEREDFPSILFQPTNATVAVGTNASFMVVALGSPTLTYQWVANGTNIDGATNAVLTLTNVQFAHAGNYFVTVSNAFGAVVSSNATLTVMAPPAITQSPTNLTLTAGATATFNAMVAGDPPLSYQWRFNGSPLADSLHVVGSATDTLTISNVQNSDTGNYTLTVTNPVGSAISTPAVLTVLTPPAVTTQPVGRSTPLGLTNIFAAAGSGSAPLSYQWQLNGTNIPGATNTSYFIAATGTNDLGVYQFVVSNAVGVAVSSNALLTVGPVAVWRYNIYNLCLVPPGLSNVTTIAGGSTFNLASRLDGTFAAWGNASGITNSSWTNVTAVSASAGGALALRSDGSVVGSRGLDPLSAKVFPSNVVAVAAGNTFGLALRAEGTVLSWGYYSQGIYNPLFPPAGLTKVTAIAAGYSHGLALRNDGKVVAWGVGSATNVPIGLSNIVAIAAGGSHSLALKSDGTLVAWGFGAGTNIPAGLSNVMAIAAANSSSEPYQSGGNASSAVLSNGTVVVWGVSSYNQTNVPAGLGNAVAVANGLYDSLALVNDGTPQILRQPAGGTAWSGRDWTLQVTAAGAAPLNYQWQLNGTNVDGATNANLFLPAIQSSNAGNYQVIVSNSLGVATSIAAPLAVMDSAPFLLTQPATNLPVFLGNRTVLASAVAGSGPLQYQWQFNGAALPGATNDSLMFDRVHMTNAGSYVLAVTNAFGFATSSVVKLTVQQVVVWGDNSYGQTNMPPGLTNVIAIGANFYNNIVLRSDGTLAIWGNMNGLYLPTNSAAGVSNVVEVSAGYNNELVLKSNGKPFMWGQGVSASLTNIVAAQSNIVAVVATSSSGGCAMLRADGTLLQVFTSGVSTSSGVTNGIALETCDDGYLVLRADGRIYNYGGGLGGSSLSTITNVLSMAAGRYQGLAVKRDGKVVDLAQTWPAVTNLSGIIGVASTYSGPEFAVRSDGSVAWGGSIVNAATNVPYGLASVRVLDAGYSHCLALLSDQDFPPVFLHNALNTSNYVVSSKGSPQWFGQTNVTHDGTNAAQSAAIGNNTASSMRTWVAGPVKVEFWWKVSSATNHGVLSFSAGGNVLTNISGEVDWQPCTLVVPPGNQILQWTYSKDGSAAAGQDAAWVDQLQITPIPPSILTQPQPASQDIVGGTNVVVAYTVTAYGTPPMNYLWEKDGITVASGSNTNFTMTNVSRTNSGTYSVFVFGPYGNATSSNAVLNVRVPQLLEAPTFQPGGSMLLSSTDADGGQLTSADLAHFQVQASTNLVDWTTLSNALVLTNGAIQLQDADAANALMRYYRILENW